MESQLKKGIIETAILAALIKEDSYGYKIVQDVGSIADISESTLYPILRRLEQADYLRTYSQEHSGRLRKYYAITLTGKDKIKAFLYDWQEVSKVYNFIVEAMR